MIWALLVVYQAKHFLADYPLQRVWMLGKFKPGWAWLWPLGAHAAVHGLFTLGIALVVNPRLWWLSLVDFGVHATVDRVKASPNLLGRFKLAPITKEEFEAGGPDMAAKFRRNRWFWHTLGLDQAAHHLTHYYVIYRLVTG